MLARRGTPVEIGENEFAIPFFRESGFVRRKCVGCGSHFWTQLPDRQTCGDVPCEEYTFIGNSPANRTISLREMREEFLSFFESKEHKIIRPYPVVARWRDDVFLVGASIYDFQPLVTEGTIPPPANPLVVSQPCLRFTDLDNVGPTAGRHLLIFEMGGHHAFNYPDKHVYWKDETTRYHHELLTDRLGVNSDLVTYKEHFWSGGGNAGPDLEACVNGLEISTLVFMQYKVVGDKLAPLPIKTVDTGYGIERWAWLTQASPSCFSVIYGPIMDRILAIAGAKIDPKIMIENTKVSGIMNIEKTSDRIEARKRVAERLGMNWRELEKIMLPIERSSAVADHTKAISFLLAEGVVPSNVEVGYLVRLLIRRTYRMLRLLGIEDKMSEIAEMQIEHWGVDFPHLIEMRGEILEALKVEEEKFKKTLERGSEMVKRISADLKAKHQDSVPAETLVQLYDSHGLVPDIVRDEAEKEGIRVNVPGNFFAMVAEKHLSATGKAEDETEKLLKEKVASFPETTPLYYEDVYQKEFEAKALGVVDGKYVVLDQTCFYSEAGGQLADEGVIWSSLGEAKVLNVRQVGKVSLHLVDGPVPNAGDVVKGTIDWDRRIALMRHHTATHVVLGAARRVLGQHAWQAGAQKGVESVRLDISHYERITIEQVREIETLAGELVMKCVPVEATWMPREKAEQMYGFVLYQGGVVPGREIRVIKTGDWDVEACGGTHVTNTGEIGLIKILKTERVQDGVERLVFAAGTAALKAIQNSQAILERSAAALNAPVEKLDNYAASAAEEKDRLSKRLQDIREQLAAIECKDLLAHVEKIGKIKLATALKKVGEEEDVLALSNQVVQTDPSVVLVVTLVRDSVRIFVAAGKGAIKAGVHSGELAGELAKLVGGGGGGKEYFGQGGGTRLENAEAVLANAKKAVRSHLKK
jgi:alanyl-tRNA synthetase